MNLYDFNSVSNAFNQSLRKTFAQTVQIHQRRMYVALHSCATVSSLGSQYAHPLNSDQY